MTTVKVYKGGSDVPYKEYDINAMKCYEDVRKYIKGYKGKDSKIIKSLSSALEQDKVDIKNIVKKPIRFKG